MNFDESSDEFGISDEADQVLEQIEEERASAEAEEDAVETVLSNAIDRIEEANVWKLLIAQHVIEPGSATDRVVNSVNGQLKRFALDRLEVLLGMDKPKKLEKPTFDSEQVRALKILAAKVLGRSIASVISEESAPRLSSAASEAVSREPRLNTVASSPGPQLRQQPQAQPRQVQAPQQQRTPVKRQQRGGRTAVPVGAKADKGFAIPSGNIRPKPMPTADQMIASAVGVSTPINLKVDAGINPSVAAQGGANLLQSVIGQLTGGNLVHVDNSAPGGNEVGDNVNERF